MPLRIVQIGNFEPEFSTENDLLDTFFRLKVEPEPLQEQNEREWDALIARLVSSERPDAVFWTRTKSLSEQIPAETRRRMQIQAHLSGVPTIGVHLDRWWGLSRQSDLYNDPFFRCMHLFTADGHDPLLWRALGANHHWMPPAIAPRNAIDGAPQAKYEAEIAFVGSWEGYGHTEWAHRPQLVDWLRKNYRGRVRFWPERGQPAVRGAELADLYASVKIVVGDSCLVPEPTTGRPWTRYLSDRAFETIGRGGFLIHPYVTGAVGGPGSLLEAGTHCEAWTLGNWAQLKVVIDQSLDDDPEMIRKRGTSFVRDNHTYRERLLDIFSIVGLEP